MNCDKVKELLWAYLENKTTAEETAEIETHLEGCAACREELAQQKETKTLWRAFLTRNSLKAIIQS